MRCTSVPQPAIYDTKIAQIGTCKRKDCKGKEYTVDSNRVYINPQYVQYIAGKEMKDNDSYGADIVFASGDVLSIDANCHTSEDKSVTVGNSTDGIAQKIFGLFNIERNPEDSYREPRYNFQLPKDIDLINKDVSFIRNI